MSNPHKKPTPPAQSKQGSKDSPVTFYPAWCKRCTNCVAFCPRQALGMDQWGHPLLSRPERCSSCGLCEMLCPDFAISVGEAARGPAQAKGRARTAPSARPSPERLAPEPAGEGGHDR